MLKINLDYAKFIFEVVMMDAELFGMGMIPIGYPGGAFPLFDNE